MESLRKLFKIIHLASRIYGHYSPQFTLEVDQFKLYQVGVSITLLIVTNLVHIKSYLVIICPNHRTNLLSMKLEFESVRTLLKITHLVSRKSYQGICPIHMKSLSQVKSGQVGVGMNIVQIHSSGLLEVISGHYLPQFTEHNFLT